MITHALIRVVLGLSLCASIAHAELSSPERTITLKPDADVKEPKHAFIITPNVQGFH